MSVGSKQVGNDFGRRIVAARVLFTETGFEARAEGKTGHSQHSSSSAVRALGRELGFSPSFDVAYQGHAAEGLGFIWHIVEVERGR